MSPYLVAERQEEISELGKEPFPTFRRLLANSASYQDLAESLRTSRPEPIDETTRGRVRTFIWPMALRRCKRFVSVSYFKMTQSSAFSRKSAHLWFFSKLMITYYT